MSWLEIWAMIQVFFMVVPFTIIVLWFAYIGIKDYIKQAMCKHEEYRENMACHAICRKCGKDLGFIGTIREQRAKK